MYYKGAGSVELTICICNWVCLYNINRRITIWGLMLMIVCMDILPKNIYSTTVYIIG
jgi:hypothetical protein